MVQVGKYCAAHSGQCLLSLVSQNDIWFFSSHKKIVIDLKFYFNYNYRGCYYSVYFYLLRNFLGILDDIIIILDMNWRDMEY